MVTLRTGPHLPETALAILNAALPDRFDLDRYARQILLDPNYRPDLEWVAYQGEEPVGYALGVTRQVPLEGEWPDPGVGYVWALGVIPSARRQGIGSALLKAVERTFQEEGVGKIVVSGYAPGYVTPGVDLDHDPSAEGVLNRRGYASGPLALSMRHPLDPLPLSVGDGDLVDDLRPHVSEVLTFARVHFGPDWVRFFRASLERQTRGDVTTGTVGAFREGELIGIAHFDGARFGPIGTHPERRGGGVGHALMRRVLERQRAVGLDHAYFLWSEEGLATRFYAPAGWTHHRRFRVMRKWL